MKRLLHIFSLILCLGLFLLPKQSFAMETMKTEHCCKKAESHDCCNQHEHKKDMPTQDCQNHCCNACHTMVTPVIAFEEVNAEVTTPVADQTGSHQFCYVAPFFNSYLQEIWQPPKIA